MFVASVKVVDIEPINFVEPERLLPNIISLFLPLDIPLTALSCPNNDKIHAVLFVGATSNNCCGLFTSNSFSIITPLDIVVLSGVSSYAIPEVVCVKVAILFVFVVCCEDKDLILLVFVDAGKISFEVKESWVDLLQIVLITVIGAYFGSRGLEKYKQK